MQFNIEQYHGKYAMHCKTREDALIFLGFLHNAGRTWSSGISYTDHTNYDDYVDDTGYSFNEGKFGDLGWYRAHGFQVLNFEDFDWNDSEITPTEKDIKQLNNFFSQFAIN